MTRVRSLATGTGRWVVTPRPNPGARLRLLCCPYAGGGVGVFRTWSERLGPDVEVSALQLPGRFGRFGEPPYRRLDALVQDALEPLRAWLRPPYGIFGHSMGALIGFELTRALRAAGEPLPEVLVVAAHRAPTVPGPPPSLHLLSDSEFLDYVKRFDGLPEEIVAREELRDLVLPTLRSDFELCDNYDHRHGTPLGCPIVALAGADDRGVPPWCIEPWAEETGDRFEMHTIAGGHFFIDTARDEVLALIAAELESRPRVA
jgi:medium-chain acyl-[acyl-carrier-protein] hydrolase